MQCYLDVFAEAYFVRGFTPYESRCRGGTRPGDFRTGRRLRRPPGARSPGRRGARWRLRCDSVKGTVVSAMTYEQMPEEWQEWLDLTPLERFRQSEQIFAQYLAMGGSLDPDPDPTSPFDFPEEWRPGIAHGRAGLCVLRRGPGEQGY